MHEPGRLGGGSASLCRALAFDRVEETLEAIDRLAARFRAEALERAAEHASVRARREMPRRVPE